MSVKVAAVPVRKPRIGSLAPHWYQMAMEHQVPTNNITKASRTKPAPREQTHEPMNRLLDALRRRRAHFGPSQTLSLLPDGLKVHPMERGRKLGIKP
jgi:hypothetical protein